MSDNISREDGLVERVAMLIHPQAWNDWQYREPNRTAWKKWARGVAKTVIAVVQAEAPQSTRQEAE